jgi:ferredoxin
MGGFEKIVRACGLRDALAGLPLELRELRGPHRVDLPEGGRWRWIELSEDALDAEVVINLPKLKTHCQMGMTLGVKNLFGCVVGLQKPQWHFRVGENREIFAELIATIARRLCPAITLIDGILAMEGDGPGSSGTPRPLGLLLASPSALALDMAVSGMVGLGPRGLLTTESLLQMGWDEEPEVVNPPPPISHFRIPDVRDMMLGPRAAHSFLRRHAVARPAPVRGRCRECGLCVQMCPARAITLASGRSAIDHSACIRCYCCLEVCPHRALRRDEPILGRIMRAIGNRR